MPSCTDPSAEHSSHAEQPFPGYVWCRAVDLVDIPLETAITLQLEEGASLVASGPAAPLRHICAT